MVLVGVISLSHSGGFSLDARRQTPLPLIFIRDESGLCKESCSGRKISGGNPYMTESSETRSVASRKERQ
jgi:hypothetical protein